MVHTCVYGIMWYCVRQTDKSPACLLVLGCRVLKAVCVSVSEHARVSTVVASIRIPVRLTLPLLVIQARPNVWKSIGAPTPEAAAKALFKQVWYCLLMAGRGYGVVLVAKVVAGW